MRKLVKYLMDCDTNVNVFYTDVCRDPSTRRIQRWSHVHDGRSYPPLSTPLPPIFTHAHSSPWSCWVRVLIWVSNSTFTVICSLIFSTALMTVVWLRPSKMRAIMG